MSTHQQYTFLGGPLDGQTKPRPVMGRIPTALDHDGNVIRVDKADQAIGRMARTGQPGALYLRIGNDDIHLTYAWIVSATLIHGRKDGAL
jgi:hypothetical protein